MEERRRKLCIVYCCVYRIPLCVTYIYIYIYIYIYLCVFVSTKIILIIIIIIMCNKCEE